MAPRAILAKLKTIFSLRTLKHLKIFWRTKTSVKTVPRTINIHFVYKLLKTLDFKAHFFNFLVRDLSSIFLADQNRKSRGLKMFR